jgi:hypothetical protein
MSRIKPYTTNQETWNTILQKNLKIPMNQREYSCELKEINKFLVDIFKIFETSLLNNDGCIWFNNTRFLRSN